MKYLYFVSFILLNCSFATAQTFDKIKTIKDAEDYVKTYNENSPELKSYYISKDSIGYYKKKYSNPNTKVFEVKRADLINAKYFVFNISKWNIERINTTRDSIIKAYKRGALPEDIIKNYNQQTADLIPFYAAIRDDNDVPEFVDAIKKHKKGEIFIFDQPAYHNLYALVIKQDDEIEKYVFTYLVKENNSKK